MHLPPMSFPSIFKNFTNLKILPGFVFYLVILTLWRSRGFGDFQKKNA